MKVERDKAIAFWGPREESAEQCARRMQHMLQDFAGTHELLAHWYKKGRSRKQALKHPIDPSYESLVKLFRANPLGRPLGYSVGWWNGAEDDHAMDMRASAGHRSMHVLNDAVLALPDDPETTGHLFEPDTLLAILTAMVRAWEPECAELGSSAMRMALYYPDDDHEWPWSKPRVGWFTYLRADRLHHLPADVPCEVIELPGLGSIFLLTRDHRMSVHRPEDMQATRALCEWLEQAGALAPMITS
jgi:hypothetical protein